MYNKWESLKNPVVQCGQLVFSFPILHLFDSVSVIVTPHFPQ